ncbi:MAG: mechanosensitive ion channel family protein, partial [Gammaproteobacteria bacterium]
DHILNKQQEIMHTKHKEHHLKKRIILKSLRWPLLFFFIAIMFALVGILQFYPRFSEWNTWFTLANNLSGVFLEITFFTFIYKLLIYSCIYYENKYKKISLTTTMIVRGLRKSLKMIFILIAVSLIIVTLMPAYLFIYYDVNFVAIGIVLSLAWLAIQMLYTSEAVLYKNIQTLEFAEKIQLYPLYTKMHIIRNIGIIVICVIAFAAILMSFSHIRQLGISILASAGVITAIIGFSGHKTFGSIITGLQMAFSQPIKIGDTILIDNKWGIVEEISFSYVYLRMKDMRRMIVPVNFFLDNKFENWTREGNNITISIHFKVDYMMPLEPLREELERILRESLFWNGKTKNLLINKLDDASVEIRVQVSTNQSEKLSLFRSEIREGFLNFMRENYPQFLPKTRQIGIEDTEEKEKGT